MKTFYWLVRREFWEHRGGFLWLPVITGGVIVILNILGIIAGEVIGGRFWNTQLIWQKVATASPEDLRQVGSVLDLTTLIPGIILSIVLFFVLFGYCSKNLSNDRNDRSILFWKSMPVSDLATVLSKAFSAVIVAPIIAVIVSVIAGILMLLTLAIASSLHGISFGEIMWALPHPGHIASTLFGLLPIYWIWMLPSVGWLMLCSAWTRGRTARWAVGLPFAVGAVISWLTLMGGSATASVWFWEHIALRVVFSVFPGSWAALANLNELPSIQFQTGSAMHVHGFSGLFSRSVGAQYQLLATPDFLWGILAGFIMIAIAIWLRRWRTEL